MVKWIQMKIDEKEYVGRYRIVDDEEISRSERHFKQRFKEPGGTSGGILMFLFGLALSIAGGYLLMNQVRVTSGFWNWWGGNTFGLTLIPLIIGIGLLFFNAKSFIGWLLAGGGAVIIFAGVLSNLQVYFQNTSLFNLLVMLVMFAGGLGLMARSFKSSS